MNKEVYNLTKNECGLLEELKYYCLYDMKSNDKFYLLCHLEDFAIKYYDLKQENRKLKLNHKQLKDIEKTMISNSRLMQENKELKEKLNKIETLTINHNCDIGDIYYKYNGKYLKSEFKENILEILYGGKNE